MAAIVIHTNSWLLEPVYRYLDSHLCLCECTLKEWKSCHLGYHWGCSGCQVWIDRIWVFKHCWNGSLILLQDWMIEWLIDLTVYSKSIVYLVPLKTVLGKFCMGELFWNCPFTANMLSVKIGLQLIILWTCRHSWRSVWYDMIVWMICIGKEGKLPV